MNNGNKGIPYLKVFGDWLIRFQKLDDAQFGRLVRAAIAYVCNGQVPTIDGMEGLSFDYLRPALDNDKSKYTEKVEKNRRNGQKGADARWGNYSERHSSYSECHLTNGENSQEKERREKRQDKGDKREDMNGADKPRKFTSPSLDDVESYCRERQNNVDAARFVDYYTANGWRIGKTTMKDWRAAVRVWERNDPKQAQPANRYDQIKKLMEETTDD